MLRSGDDNAGPRITVPRVPLRLGQHIKIYSQKNSCALNVRKLDAQRIVRKRKREQEKRGRSKEESILSKMSRKV